MSKRIYKILAILFILGHSVHAQEGLRSMYGNPNLIYPELNYFGDQQNISSAKTMTGSLGLPFFDDFHYACTSTYPNPLLWKDSSVYVNTGMPRAPLSVGVASFDGLNKKGYPYDPTLNIPATVGRDADTLTSQPINLFVAGSQTLQPSDSLALIFYYQQTGNGDSPELQDSLMVDFYSVDSVRWNNRIWALKGNVNPSGADTLFKRVFLWITDPQYFKDGFRFRFRNKAGTNGNYDNWHIDYVFLDKGRSMRGDTAFNDLTIGYIPSPFLKNYSAMPWRQYNANPSGEMGTLYSNFIRYNGTSTINTTYEYRIFDEANTQVNFQSYGAANLPPFKPGGWQHNATHAIPQTSYTFATLTDSTDFTIKHYMQSIGGDINIGNDTVYQKHRFRNYFAYDDGTCETGYYVNNFGANMVQKYTLNIGDTLRALRIYFDPIYSVVLHQQDQFRIKVYTSNGFSPGTLLLRDSIMSPKFSTTGHNVFATYYLTTPLVLTAGSYFIGIQQGLTGTTGYITIGFDRNYNSSSKLFYDSGSGWTQSSYYGSLMMRPVFGEKILPPVGIPQHNFTEYPKEGVYPNPASDQINIISNAVYEYSIYTMEGKLVLSGSGKTISTVDLNNGIYLLVLSSQDQPIKQAGKVEHRQKIIIQH